MDLSSFKHLENKFIILYINFKFIKIDVKKII